MSGYVLCFFEKKGKNTLLKKNILVPEYSFSGMLL